jgi:hypothetical protein
MPLSPASMRFSDLRTQLSISAVEESYIVCLKLHLMAFVAHGIIRCIAMRGPTTSSVTCIAGRLNAKAVEHVHRL